MKAETLQKRINAKLTTTNGVLQCKFYMLETLLINGKFYGKHYRGSGRFITLSDCGYYNAIKALELLGIDYTTGNDAPRGGKTGDFVELTPKGKRQVAEWVKIRIAENNEKTKIELAKRATEQKAREEREAAYQLECEATYNAAKERGVSFEWNDSNWRWVPWFNHSKNEIEHGTINKIIYHELAIAAGVKNNKGWRKYVDEVVQSKFEPEFIQRKSR